MRWWKSAKAQKWLWSVKTNVRIWEIKKDDSTHMFKAMKKIKKIKSKPVLVINHKNQYTANEWKQVRIIANHFTKRFKRDKPQTTMFRSSINTNENTIFKRRKYP